MTRKEIMDIMYDAAVSQARAFGFENASIKHSGSVTSWMFPVMIKTDELPEKKEQFIGTGKGEIQVIFRKEDGFLVMDASSENIPDRPMKNNIEMFNVSVFQQMYEDDKYDASMHIFYSDAKRKDGYILHTGDYIRQGASYSSGNGKRCLEQFEGYISGFLTDKTKRSPIRIKEETRSVQDIEYGDAER